MENPDRISNSNVQIYIEKVVIEKLQILFDCELKSDLIKLDQISIQVDAFNLEKKIFVEIYSGTGKLKPAQIKKVIADASKLTLLDSRYLNCKKYVCFVDEDVQSKFNSINWYSIYLIQNNVETIYQQLSDSDYDLLVNVKKLQK